MCRRRRKFPGPAQVFVCDDLKTEKDGRAAWRLAGEGWKVEVRRIRDNLLDAFHTPRPGAVDALYLRVLGLKSISSVWK
jgi:hypothetical protein